VLFSKASVGCYHRFDREFIIGFNGAINHPEQNYYYSNSGISLNLLHAINVNLIKRFLSDLTR
jgi:hypothetical protein